MPLPLAPWALVALLVAVAGLLFWRLEAATEKLGAMQAANERLTITLAEKENALKSRAATDSDVRRLPPDGVLDRLRP